MAVLQSMKKTPVLKYMSDLQDAFIKRIEWMMIGYHEGRVVFDRYQCQSLKNKTRQKRAAKSMEYEIHPNMRLTMSLRELLSSSKTKRSLTIMIAQKLLDHYSTISSFKMVVAYDTKIKGQNFEQEHSHEEADTLIPHQVLASQAEHDANAELNVWSPDTDVLTLLLDLVSRGHLKSGSQLKFLTGKGTKFREINVVDRVRVIGPNKCQGLIGIHNFSGADWGGKFVGITKKTWISTYMKLEDTDPIIACFQNLGEAPINTNLVDGELPINVQPFEKFVCRAYNSKGHASLPALRWELFRSKNLEGEMLPPTRAVLLPHITRANYIAMRDKSYTTNSPALPPIEENGWHVEKEVYVPVRCLALPAPRAVIELTKCGCKAGCKGARCSCFKNKLPCTPLCKCYVSDCANMTHNYANEDEE